MPHLSTDDLIRELRHWDTPLVRLSLAIRHLVPAIYEFRHFCGAGGLISWLASTPDVFSRATSQPNYRPAP